MSREGEGVLNVPGRLSEKRRKVEDGDGEVSS